MNKLKTIYKIDSLHKDIKAEVRYKSKRNYVLSVYIKPKTTLTCSGFSDREEAERFFHKEIYYFKNYNKGTKHD